MIGIIPSAGYGTRLKELGKEYPKCILPYREKPILVWNVEWMIKNGCDDIRIVINHQSEKVIEIINNYNLPVKIVKPLDMSGLSMSIFSALNDDKFKDSVLIVLGDILVCDENKKTKIDFDCNWVSTFEVDDWERWCMIDPSTGIFYDKPAKKPPTNQAISGVYYFKDSQLLKEKLKEQCDKNQKINGELQLSTTIEKLSNKIQTKNLEVLDFGTLDNYLKNKGIKKCRNFNTIECDKNHIIKRSFKKQKIVDEYNWFSNIPLELKPFTPKIFNHNFFDKESEYTMERVYLPTLREVYLFFDRSEQTWTRILNSCKDIQNIMNKYSYPYSSFSEIYEKTFFRIKESGLENEIEVNQFLNDFIFVGQKVDTWTKLQHGDFCFSNLFWDELKSSILMIDPRGSVFGSKFYDWAKLRHSAVYNYDFIDAELYTVNENTIKVFDDGTDNVSKILNTIELEIFTEEEISYLDLLTSSLFLSMIPLHSHNKINQKIYYDKFKNIYLNWKKNN